MGYNYTFPGMTAIGDGDLGNADNYDWDGPGINLTPPTAADALILLADNSFPYCYMGTCDAGTVDLQSIGGSFTFGGGVFNGKVRVGDALGAVRFSDASPSAFLGGLTLDGSTYYIKTSQVVSKEYVLVGHYPFPAANDGQEGTLTLPSGANVQSGAAQFGVSDALTTPSYPTTAATQAAQIVTDASAVNSALGGTLNTAATNPSVTLGSTTITVHTATWEAARNTDPGIANVASGTAYKIANASLSGTAAGGGGGTSGVLIVE